MTTPSLRPINRKELVRIQNRPDGQYKERIVDNRTAERYQLVSRLTTAIGLLLVALEGLIGFRIVLRLIAANPENAFVVFIYGLSRPFVVAFLNLTVSPEVDGIILEIPSLIAMAVYAFSGWLVIRLIWVLLYRRGTRNVTAYETEK